MLVAEVVVAGLAQRIGLHTPRLVGLQLDPEIARYEADEEVQDLLKASAGLNLGVDFLPGSFGYDGTAPAGATDPARVLWLDAFCANVDRSWRNPNLLLWHGDLWVIDHGASLYFHHGWSAGVGDPERFAAQPWNADDHIFKDRVDRAAGRRRGAPRPARARGLRRGAGRRTRRVARAGARCRGPRRRCARRTSRSSPPGSAPPSGSRGAPRELPTSTSCCAASRASTARSSSTSAWCSTARRPTTSTRSGTSTPTGSARLDPRVDVEQVCDALAYVDGVCAGDERGGAAAQQPIGNRFGFLKAPRSTVLQPGPVHGGVTADPARELERLLHQLVG